MYNARRDNLMVEMLVENDIEYIFEDPDGIPYIYDILAEGSIGYHNLSTIELEDELTSRGIDIPPYNEEFDNV